MTSSAAAGTLKRTLNTPSAVLMGLGSIIGTGVFVSLGIGASVIGPAVILAVILAAFVAIFNGLNSAQLAANHPVSGGTYEYGYRYLNPQLGFVAGWTFLLAKSASAATAALGFAGYLLHALGASQSGLHIVLALAAIGILTAVCAGGIQRSNRVNSIIVAITLFTLGIFVVAALTRFDAANLTPFVQTQTQTQTNEASSPLSQFLYTTALMFVAYTGYGRIATLGEEVREPRRTIPRAIITALLLTMIIYTLVAFSSIGSVGAAALRDYTQQAAAPLEGVAQALQQPFVAVLVTLGAITAMLSVLLNLILGLSRVLLAMGRRRDMPPFVAYISPAGTPTPAVIVMGGVIALLALTGSVQTTWSFSAFTVLIYYAITNLAALQLKPAERFFPRIIAWCGLGACAFLAFQVDTAIWVVGLFLIGGGLVWQQIARRIFASLS